MSNTTERIVKEIDITIRYNGKNSVHELYFDDGDEVLTEEEMYELGFCGDVVFEEDGKDDLVLSLDASNPEWYNGKVIDGLAFNLYPLGNPLAGAIEYAEVVGYEVIYE